MVKIHVLFWGGWNYKPKADKFIEELSKLCTFEATLEKKPGGSGCFEVTIEGTLVHPKLNGDGCVKEDKLKQIAQMIQAKK